jgi:hypothetical protein
MSWQGRRRAAAAARGRARRRSVLKRVAGALFQLIFLKIFE